MPSIEARNAVIVENTIVRRLRALSAINQQLQQVVSQGLNINFVLPEVLRTAMDELNATAGSIIVVNENLEILHSWLIADGQELEDPGDFLKEAVRKGLFGWTVRSRKPTIIADTLVDERWLSRQDDPNSNRSLSAICVPLVIRHRSLGAITMSRPGIGQFDLEDLDLLAAIADQAAITIESARLYESSLQRADELSALVRAASALSATLETNRLLTEIGRQMALFTRADACAIFEWLPDSDIIRRLSLYAGDEIALDGRLMRRNVNLADFPLTRRLLQEHVPIERHLGQESLQDAEYQYMFQAGIKSLLMIPMVSQDKALGVVEICHFHTAHRFDHAQVQLVQMLANQAAIALQNAGLFENIEHQLRVSALLHEAGKVINSSLDARQILQSLLVQTNELLVAEAISIALIDRTTNELVYEVAAGPGRDRVVGTRMALEKGIAGWVVQNSLPALVPDAGADSRFHRAVDQQTGYKTVAMICAPLIAQGEVLGTIQAINPSTGHFTPDDLDLLVNLANLASSALANARQFERVQAAEARYLGLFDDSINSIILTDLQGGIVEANRQAYLELGILQDSLVGRSIHDFHVISEGQTIDLEGIASLAMSKVSKFRLLLRRRDDTPLPVEVHVKRTSFHGDPLLQWIYHDISQQVELDKMRQDLTAMLVHDLQNPLGNVISSLELLRLELSQESGAVADSILDVALKSSRRLQNLIRSIMDITHLESGHPLADLSPFDLVALVMDTIQITEPLLGPGRVRLKLSEVDTLPKAQGDADLVRRVLVNLLDNCAKYSPESKQVTIEIGAGSDKNQLKVSVCDQGPGVPPEYRKAIFQQFRRLERTSNHSPKGIGLGLAFCRLAIEAHGGEIWVDDAPGGGACFSFTLPVASI